MGINTKNFIKQILLGLCLAIVTAMTTGFVISQRTEAVNNYKMEQNCNDIQSMKEVLSTKADKDYLRVVKFDLTERLDRIEMTQMEIIKLIKQK